MFDTNRVERSGFAARRSVVMARDGMVASSQPLAVEAGVSILKKGGTAIDAAIATALTLGVVEPVSTGIGGDAFLLYHSAADGRIYGINGSGRCPRRLTLDELQRRGIKGIPSTGLASVTVPGAIDAFVEAQRRHGKLTFAEVLEPAIHYASEGFPGQRDHRQTMAGISAAVVPISLQRPHLSVQRQSPAGWGCASPAQPGADSQASRRRRTGCLLQRGNRPTNCAILAGERWIFLARRFQ